MRILIREGFSFHLHTENFYHLEKNILILKLLPHLKHKHFHYAILGYHNNKLSDVNMLHEWKLCSRSRTRVQPYFCVSYLLYANYNILSCIYEV
jgi:hypothetical protein